MQTMQSMLDETSEWEDKDKELESISRILKNAYGESFERASIHEKLFFLENTSRCMRLDVQWETCIEITDLEFPEYFEDTQEAMNLIRLLSVSISQDMTFHNLPIEGLC